MPRTVVPPVRVRGAGPGAAGGDGWPERLAKYVPAETLAFFVPVATGIGPHRSGLLVVVLCAGLLGTIGYLWLAGQRAAPDERPRPHFFVLASVAFVSWAVGTSPNVALLFGVDLLTAGVWLGLAVFLIPVADEVLNRWAYPAHR